MIRTGETIDANPAWLNLFGYSRDELKGFNASDLYVDPQGREDFLRRMAATGFVEDEVRFKKKDGTVMDCVRTAVARKDRHGESSPIRVRPTTSPNASGWKHVSWRRTGNCASWRRAWKQRGRRSVPRWHGSCTTTSHRHFPC